MRNSMDMTDDEFLLHQARQCAARAYRSEGFAEFAEQVELGLEDGCNQVRLARFFIDPPEPHTEEFIAAWRAMAAAGEQTSHPLPW
jgi:hypothetical protein